ncbi:hypothetical protein ABVT39_000549 [Epinephelus coioides]
MLRHRKARRLQRLREHHNDCQERYDMEITAKTQAEHEKNLQLIELDCVEADSLSESSYDLESDYAPSSSDSSDNENHDVPPSSEVGAVQESQVSGNDLEIFNERSFEDSDEEVNILTQKSVTRRPLDEKKRTEKTEEIDVLTENTVTGRPSDEMKKSEKREEIDVLTENTVTGRPSDEMKKSEKREEIDVLTQNTVTGRPSDEMKKSEKREEVDVLTENTGRPSDEMKKSEKRGLNPQFRKKKKCHRRPWSSEEKAAVWRQLGRYITLHRVPGKELCVKAIEAEQVLCSRNWKDVKNQVYNSITSQKRKQL